MKKSLLHVALFAAAATPAMASGVKVVGTLPVVVDQAHRQARAIDSMRVQPPKVVSLMKVELSKDAKQVLSERIHTALNSKKSLNATFHQSLPSDVQLDMNHVPVLDQGMHGSCVTFANSGAIDALLGKGDYVSQLCSLALGKYLEEQDYNHPSGWDGSWGPIVLEQFFNYGVVSLDNQREHSCGGMSEYPVSSYSTGSAMSANDYQGMSESISQLNWTPIVSSEEALSKNKSITPDEVLEQVKTSLATGSRVTFGVLLDVYYGSNGAVGTHNKYHDTWMLNDEIKQDADDGYINAGHEMIITGYDDNAEYQEERGDQKVGEVKKGLLTLRNSWGEGAGDNGNYYMSYEHFKALALEAQSLNAK